MKKKHIILISWLAVFMGGFARQENKLNGNWIVELKNNDIGVVRTILTFEGDSAAFTAFSRKNADKDIFGKWKSTLGRTFTKDFKGGSFLHIVNGKITHRGDSTILAGIFTSSLGNYYFNGYVENNRLHAVLRTANKKIYGYMDGVKEDAKTPLEDYPAIFEKCVAITKTNIYNAQTTKTKEWSSFEAQMRKASAKAQDDLDMVFAFYYYAAKLPFSHYALMKMPPKDADEKEEKERYVFLEEKTPRTVYMQITSFSGTANEMDSAFEVINKKGYENLIVDLRDNPGGSVEAGMAFAKNIAANEFYGGVFLTQKWFNSHSGLPSQAEYSTFKSFTASSYDLIISGIHKEEGLCLKVIPNEKTYRGTIYVLTNKNTASTCEPLVYSLKQNKRATLVGETTAGVMLNGEFFDVTNGFKIIVPTADYYASDGYRIDQKGVVPNVKTKAAEALQYVLANMIAK